MKKKFCKSIILFLVGAILLSSYPSYARRVKIPNINSTDKLTTLEVTARREDGSYYQERLSTAEALETIKEYADLVAAYIVREKTGIIPTNVPSDIASIIESIFNTEEKASLEDVLWFILISEYTKTPFSNFPKINSLPDGYRLIKDIDEFRNTFNCFGYALNKDEGVTVEEFKTILENDFTEIDIPQNGDLVVYINRDIGIVHAGIYSNGKVISKFNHGPVLEHPIDGNIPDIWAWGEYKFYRRR